MEHRRAHGRGPVTRPDKTVPLLYWLLGGFAALMLLFGWILAYLVSDRVIANLGEQPITGFMNRFATATDQRGHCATEFWRLSDESRKMVSENGLMILAPPHRAERGFEPARWRPASEIDAGALPWNANHCPEADRVDFLALSTARRSVVAVMRKKKARSDRERAIFLLDLDEGVFARAVFSGEALGRLDAAGGAEMEYERRSD